MDDAEQAPGAPRSAAEARARVEAERAARSAAREAELAAAFPGGLPGRPTIWVSWAATLVATLVSVAALVDVDAFLGAYFAVTFALFLAGSGVFVVDLVLAAARSTTHTMGIGGLFFLAGSAPRAARLALNASLAAAVVVSVATALARLSTPELAFGTLAPTFQLSLSGWWGVRHGHFPPRAEDGAHR
jgi:hypothetical protein